MRPLSHVLHLLHTRKVCTSRTACETLNSELVTVLMSWMECKWLGEWQRYFMTSVPGFSGVCFGLQVVLFASQPTVSHTVKSGTFASCLLSHHIRRLQHAFPDVQVMRDHLRGGALTVGSGQLIIPARFSCWVNLVVTQVLVPRANLTVHLCGILAGLLHVYIPKSGIFASDSSIQPCFCCPRFKLLCKTVQALLQVTQGIYKRTAIVKCVLDPTL